MLLATSLDTKIMSQLLPVWLVLVYQNLVAEAKAFSNREKKSVCLLLTSSYHFHVFSLFSRDIQGVQHSSCPILEHASRSKAWQNIARRVPCQGKNQDALWMACRWPCVFFAVLHVLLSLIIFEYLWYMLYYLMLLGLVWSSAALEGGGRHVFSWWRHPLGVQTLQSLECQVGSFRDESLYCFN